MDDPTSEQPDARPPLVSDPAADGLPETADPDSHANPEDDATRIADGPDPASLPADRDEGPVVTELAFADEPQSLESRLAQEEPDVTAADVPTDPDPGLAADLDPEWAGRLAADTESLGGPVEPHLDSSVSTYDRELSGVPGTDPVGRLARADGDGLTDTEPDEVAVDTGAGGGGFSGEEAALHAIASDELDAEQGEPEPYIRDVDPDDIDAAQSAAERPSPRTGAEQPWDPEDLAIAEGRDPTPENVERARRKLEELGPSAIERTVP